ERPKPAARFDRGQQQHQITGASDNCGQYQPARQSRPPVSLRLFTHGAPMFTSARGWKGFASTLLGIEQWQFGVLHLLARGWYRGESGSVVHESVGQEGRGAGKREGREGAESGVSVSGAWGIGLEAQ